MALGSHMEQLVELRCNLAGSEHGATEITRQAGGDNSYWCAPIRSSIALIHSMRFQNSPPLVKACGEVM